MIPNNNFLDDVSTVSKRPSTDTYFNNYYNPMTSVSTDADAAIQSFFEQTTVDKASARQLTQAVVYTALSQGLSPMEVLTTFKNQPPGQLDLYLATFLNLNRVNTSLLGIINTPRTSSIVQRSIIA
jgi:hypothetical protein